MPKRRIAVFLSLFVCAGVFSESDRLDPGVYYLLDGRVNVRSEPNLSGTVLGQLSANTMVTIIECAFNEQIINNVSSYWYKIEYNTSYGYIWGGLIAHETFSYTDAGGLNYMLHYRVSRVKNGENLINRNTDIFIYINGRHRPNNFMFNESDPPYNLPVWNECMLHRIVDGPSGPTDGVGFTLIIKDEIFNPGDPGVAYYTFFIDRNGTVTPIGGSYTSRYWDRQRKEYYREHYR